MRRIEILHLCLTVVAVIFAATSIFLPWWSLHLSPEAKTILKSEFRADYTLLKTVSSILDNQSVTVNLTNLTSTEDPNASSFGFMDTTLYLVVGGLVFSVPMIIGASVLRKSKYLRFILILGYLSSVLLLLSVIYFNSEVATPISRLSKIGAINAPEEWTPINPSDITSAWGSKAVATGSPILSWLSSGNFWIWQPSTGWYLALSASLLVAVSALTTRLFMEQEKKLAMRTGVRNLSADTTLTSKKQ